MIVKLDAAGFIGLSFEVLSYVGAIHAVRVEIFLFDTLAVVLTCLSTSHWGKRLRLAIIHDTLTIEHELFIKLVHI